MKNRLVSGSLALCLFGLSSSANAAYLVNTGSGVPNMGGYSLSSFQSLAGYFTLASASTIGSVEGFIGGQGGGTVTVTIYANGPIPAVSLFSASFTSADTLNGSGDQWQGVFGQNWALAAGSYWVGFGNTGSDYMTFTGTPNPLSAYAFDDSVVWSRFDQLNVGIRIAAMVGNAPEPATWAMMLGGLGLVGGALRKSNARRRQKVSVTYA